MKRYLEETLHRAEHAPRAQLVTNGPHIGPVHGVRNVLGIEPSRLVSQRACTRKGGDKRLIAKLPSSYFQQFNERKHCHPSGGQALIASPGRLPGVIHAPPRT